MFWKSRVEEKLRRMENALQKSFANVRNDTNNIFQWLDFLYKNNNEQASIIREQSKTIKKLQEEISEIPKKPEEIKQIVDSYYSFGSILDQIHRLNRRIDEILQRTPEPGIKRPAEDLSVVKERLQKLEQKKPMLKEKIIKRLTKNSKDYIKSVIISHIRKYESISALQLKEIVVDEQGLCSKSSFYRILEEVENLDEIGAIKKGKEKHYLFKAMKRL